MGTTTMIRKNSASLLRKLMPRAQPTPGTARSTPRPAAPRAFRRATLVVRGAIAQLGERLDRTQEVGGSSPPSSTPRTPGTAGVLALWVGTRRRFRPWGTEGEQAGNGPRGSPARPGSAAGARARR